VPFGHSIPSIPSTLFKEIIYLSFFYKRKKDN
jgi:hypothetical protein